MRLLKRCLVTAAITLGVIAIAAFWILPVSLSLIAARNASPITRMVPTELKDLSVAQAPGRKLSYFGYEFEIPWDDLDESQARIGSKDNPSLVILPFRSGLRLIVRVSLQGPDPMLTPHYVYNMSKSLYEFTPEKMHFWALSPSLHYDERLALMGKATMLSGSADTGIFKIQSQNYRGFQLGNPESHPQKITVTLYSDEGSIEFIFVLNAYPHPAAVTQPKINRIVQSLRKVPQNGPPAGS